MNNNIKNIVFILILSLIILGGFLLRVRELGQQSLWIDEIYTINAGKALLEHGYPLLDSGVIYVNNFVSVYLSGLIIKFFTFDPFNPWLVRLPAVVFGTALIFAVYVFARRLYSDKIVALSSAFFVAFSYHEIAFSRQVRGYAMFSVFIVFCLYFLFSYLESKNRKYLYVSIVLFTLACLSHWVALAFIVPIMVIWWLNTQRDQYFPHLSKLQVVSVSILVLIFLTILMMTFYQSGAVVVRYFLFSTIPFIAILVGLLCKKIIVELFITRNLFFGLVLLGIVVILGSHFLVFYPKSHYQLGSASPQPDYASVFSFISEVRGNDDLVITLRPVLQKTFFGEDGVWISRSMDGKSVVDTYTGIPAVTKYEELLELTRDRDGYLVSDSYVFEDNFRKKNTMDSFRLFYVSGDRVGDKIWLYTF